MTLVRIQIPQPYIFLKGGCKQEASAVTTELTTAITAIKAGLADYNVSNLTLIWVAGVGIAAAPAIAWFAYRFVKGKVTKAVFKGRL